MYVCMDVALSDELSLNDEDEVITIHEEDSTVQPSHNHWLSPRPLVPPAGLCQ